MSKRSFLKEFIRENKTVGSLTPSSRFLAAKMLDNIDFSTMKTIVELGPGTGVFTRKIVEKLPENVLFLVFELNEGFCNQLQKQFNQKNVKIIHASADQLKEYLEQHDLKQADIIISSLPLANLNQSLRMNIIETIHSALSPEGKFIQFQYSLQSKKILKNWFKDVSIGFTALNIPPAFVYTCKK